MYLLYKYDITQYSGSLLNRNRLPVHTNRSFYIPGYPDVIGPADPRPRDKTKSNFWCSRIFRQATLHAAHCNVVLQYVSKNLNLKSIGSGFVVYIRTYGTRYSTCTGYVVFVRMPAKLQQLNVPVRTAQYMTYARSLFSHVHSGTVITYVETVAGNSTDEKNASSWRMNS
jgi:hypothetical protein